MNIMDQEPKNQHNQHADYIETSVIGVRCPKCLKLYAVDKTEIKEAKPKFECNKCNTRFWLPFPVANSLRELIGFPVSWLEDSDMNKPLPSSVAAPVTTSEQERIDSNESVAVFAKFHHDVGVPHSRRLKDLWNIVVEDYGNEVLHQQFVKMCQKENNLAFASKKYAHILNTVSDDEIAHKMIREIDGMVQVWLTRSQTPKKQSTLKNRIAWFGIAMGLILVALGLSFFQLRNLVGIGAVLSFLALAMQGFFPSKN